MNMPNPASVLSCFMRHLHDIVQAHQISPWLHSSRYETEPESLPGILLCNNIDLAAAHASKPNLAAGTMPLLEKLNSSKKPILFTSNRPVASLNATIRQLKRDGFDTFWQGVVEVKADHQTYAVSKVSDMALTGFGIGNLVDFIYTFANMEKGLALYHYQGIYSPEWDFQRVAICYASTLALIRTVKECRKPGSSARLGLYMHDAIKSGVKNYPAGEACGRLFKAMMAEAEAIVFSSSTIAFGDFVEDALGQKLPKVHHHRHQCLPGDRRPRLKGAYHIVILTSVLGDVWQPISEEMQPYLRSVIDQGIHIHYYAATNRNFVDTLPKEQQHRFHVHAPIHNLEDLANELSQYHAGWSLFNMHVFSDMITRLTDQFTRDALDVLRRTTLPSVVLSCAAAGLPIIFNRSMAAVSEMLPQGLRLPITFSEIHMLHQMLDALDWEAIDCIDLKELDISHHIHKLHAFLDDYYPTAVGV